MQARPKYNDVKFFLIAIAFISAFNYYLTWNHIKLNWFLVLTYIIDTVQGWLAWWAVRSIIIYLDKKIPYGDQPLKRIFIQLVITTITGLLIIILLTELESLIARGHTAPLSFYLFDIFIICIWFFVINGIYIGMHYYSEWKESEHQRQEEKKVRAAGFTVKLGKQNLLVQSPLINHQPSFTRTPPRRCRGLPSSRPLRNSRPAPGSSRRIRRRGRRPG